eukprot:1106597-Amphidinium_carterae.1
MSEALQQQKSNIKKQSKKRTCSEFEGKWHSKLPVWPKWDNTGPERLFDGCINDLDSSLAGGAAARATAAPDELQLNTADMRKASIATATQKASRRPKPTPPATQETRHAKHSVFGAV